MKLASSYLSTISLPPSSNTTSPFLPCLCLPLILQNRFTSLHFSIFIPVISFNSFLFHSCNFILFILIFALLYLPRSSCVILSFYTPSLLSFIACLSSAGILLIAAVPYTFSIVLQAIPLALQAGISRLLDTCLSGIYNANYIVNSTTCAVILVCGSRVPAYRIWPMHGPIHVLDIHGTGTKHIVRHSQKSVVQWSRVAEFTCIGAHPLGLLNDLQ